MFVLKQGKQPCILKVSTLLKHVAETHRSLTSSLSYEKHSALQNRSRKPFSVSLGSGGVCEAVLLAST